MNKSKRSNQWKFICVSIASEWSLLHQFHPLFVRINPMLHHEPCNMRQTFIFTVNFTFSTKKWMSKNIQWTNNCQAFWVMTLLWVECCCSIEIQTKIHGNVIQNYSNQNLKIDRKLHQCYKVKLNIIDVMRSYIPQ